MGGAWKGSCVILAEKSRLREALEIEDETYLWAY